MKEPKFPECTGCRFYSTKIVRAECGECGAGEFFEPRISCRQPSREELMDIYRKTYDE